MRENPLLKLQPLGQSVWIDYIRRQMIPSGELKRLIDEDGVLGVTSNPSIFDKVIAGSHDYDDAIHRLSEQGKGPEEIYQALTVEDIQKAADLFRPLYDLQEGRDGRRCKSSQRSLYCLSKDHRSGCGERVPFRIAQSAHDEERGE